MNIFDCALLRRKSDASRIADLAKVQKLQRSGFNGATTFLPRKLGEDGFQLS